MPLPRQSPAPLSAAGLPDGPAVFLSPHYDDVAFSCAGTVAELVERGREVHLVTAFSAGRRPPQGFALECQTSKGIASEVDYMALRDREDEAFARLAGLAGRHVLGLLEAPHRGYESPAALFGAERADDRATAALGAERLRRLLGELGAAAIWAPLGVGGHVDHRIARRIAARAAGPAALLLYPEQPYLIRDAAAGAAALAGSRAPGRWLYAEVADRLEERSAAVACYRSQLGFQLRGIGSPVELARRVALAGARSIGHDRPVEISRWRV